MEKWELLIANLQKIVLLITEGARQATLLMSSKFEH